jgi:hypothetical protein
MFGAPLDGVARPAAIRRPGRDSVTEPGEHTMTPRVRTKIVLVNRTQTMVDFYRKELEITGAAHHATTTVSR